MTVLSSGSEDTWGVVLAGGYPRAGSLFERLRPRPLLPVALRPIVSFPLRWLREADVAGATVCLNEATREVRQAVEAEADVPRVVSFREDPTPRGTAGVVRDAAADTEASTLLVVDATAIPEIDPRALLELHRRESAALTVVARRAAVPAAAGLSPSGVYVLDRRALDFVPSRGFHDIKENLLPRLHEAGERVATLETDGPGPRVVDAVSYLAANERLIGCAVEGEAPVGFFRSGHALLHASARVSAGARLVGPVIVGPEAAVGEGATVVGPAAIGAGCQVGPGAVVSRSVLWDRCAVGADAMVDRCLVADGAVVPERVELYGAFRAGFDPAAPRALGQPRAEAHAEEDEAVAPGLPAGAR
jgi:NDP-sugar pyrophosphorylase family protein